MVALVCIATMSYRIVYAASCCRRFVLLCSSRGGRGANFKKMTEQGMDTETWRFQMGAGTENVGDCPLPPPRTFAPRNRDLSKDARGKKN